MPGRGRGRELVNMRREEKRQAAFFTCEEPEGEGDRRRDGSVAA